MKKLAKILSSLTMAAVLSCTSLTAFAADCIAEDEVYGIDIEEFANWGIDDFAASIKTQYKLEYPDQAEIIDAIVDAIASNEVFIEMFDDQGESAFQIIEDSLREVLEPSVSLCDSTDELYFSKYNVSPIKQESSSKNAAAATLMALIGSGVSGYTQTTINNQFNADTSSQTINKITNLLKSKIPNKSDTVGVRTRAFTTAGYGSDWLIDCIGDSLVGDKVPVIQISNASNLRWYKNGETGTRYLVATCVDTLAECVTFYDPDSSHFGTHYLDYDEIYDLMEKEKVIWVSAYDEDRGASGLARVMAEYPHWSNFTRTGGECTEHSSLTSCGYFDSGWQCAGFARYVFYNVKGRKYSASSAYKREINENINATTAKQRLYGLSLGTYVRLDTAKTIYANPYESLTGHSIAIIRTTSNDITLAQANYGGKCKVSYVTYTWADFAARFPTLYFYMT